MFLLEPFLLKPLTLENVYKFHLPLTIAGFYSMLGPCFVVMLETGLAMEKILQVLQRSPEAGCQSPDGLVQR